MNLFRKKVLLKEYAIEWLVKEEANVKHRTYHAYEKIIINHINPQLGMHYLDKLESQSIENFKNYLSEKGNLRTGSGLKESSIAQILVVLKQILAKARKEKLMIHNPIEDIKCKRNRKSIEVFTELEQHKIEEYIIKTKRNNLYGILITLYTGIRIGELLALTWENVDLVNRSISITATKSPIPLRNSFYIGTPKSSNGKRIIPIPKELLYYFKELKKEKKTYVINRTDGEGITLGSYQITFRRILKRLNIRPRGFHVLRHTFATRAIENGVDINTLSELLGHSTPTITLNFYAHSSDKLKVKIINKMGQSMINHKKIF